MKSDWSRYRTLTELLQVNRCESKGITFIEKNDSEEFMSYDDLYKSSLQTLHYFQSKNIRVHDELVLQLDDNKQFLIVFWACILGGIIPIPLSVGQNDEHKRKIFSIWPVLSNPYFFTTAENLANLDLYATKSGQNERFEQIQAKTFKEISVQQGSNKGEVYAAKQTDIAFVQFSSGSTGSPKGVILTHKNLLTNIRAISIAAKYCRDDSSLSWMPLTHDMGLIGFHLNPLFVGMNQYLIPTNRFIRRPSIWLDKASQHKISVLCSPNFGYKYLIKHNNLSFDWNLSSVRIIYNGAEPISEQLCQEFIEKFSIYGLRRESMCPVYGLAEASLAVSISELEDEVLSVKVKRSELKIGKKIIVEESGANSLVVVNVGKTIEDCMLRITDEENLSLSDETVGYVQIQGKNVTSGYYNNVSATRTTILEDGWLKTGDVGFIKDGSLFITGRVRDIIFVNGQNIYAHDIERVAEGIDGIELNKIVVIGYTNEAEVEEIIAFVFHRGEIGKFVNIANSLISHINFHFGFQIDRVIPVKDIPRTTSGKLQRYKLLDQFREGFFKDIDHAIGVFNSNLSESSILPNEELNDTEARILRIFKEVLKTKQLTVSQRFFEVGGNSLKAAELGMSLLKELNVELTLKNLYEDKTIGELIKEIVLLGRTEYAPIKVIKENKYYQVSSVQSRIYYACAVDPLSIAYNIPQVFKIVGDVDYQKLTLCVEDLIQRHDSLRMTFHLQSELVFKVNSRVDAFLDFIQYDRLNIQEYLKSLIKPFDLSKGPLFRIVLIQVGLDAKLLFIDFHHIIADGISMYIFLDELFKLYTGKEISTPSIQYKDYSSWENEILSSQNNKQRLDYWYEKLGGELPLLKMPVDFPRPAVFKTEGSKVQFQLNREMVEQLRRLAYKEGCTLHSLLFTAYSVFLQKYTGQEDIIIGIPVAGRIHPDIQNTLGVFVNNLAIRSHLDSAQSFLTALKISKSNISDAFEYYIPFEFLINSIGGNRDISRNPIFDTMFIYQNMGVPQVQGTGFSLDNYFIDPGFSKFDLSLEVFEYADNISYSFEYSTQLFRKETILQLHEHFQNLLNVIIKAPDIKLADLCILTDNEYHQYVNTFNATQQEYPRDKTIYELFEEQVLKTPANIAIEFFGEAICYKKLEIEASRIALALQERGVKQNTKVGILLERSPQLIISILGVLKAGACYLPVDISLPKERIKYIVENSNAKLVITTQDINNLFSDSLSKLTEVVNYHELDCTTDCYVSKKIGTDQFAYVIYTSGTTGNPKGVPITHRSLVNYVTWAAKNYISESNIGFALFTSISFDLTVTSIFTPLITGNRVVVYKEEVNEVLIERVINDNKTEILKLTPSHLKIMRDSVGIQTRQSKIRTLIVGGEKLDSQLCREVYKKFDGKIEIFNEYGPTEASVGCMIYKFNPEDDYFSVPIGIPAANTQIYILDPSLQPVPPVIIGELYISGDCLSPGYLFNEELTQKKFIQNPFVTGNKIYKTGDLVRRLLNGNIEYIGRIDQQVKISGHRVELAEIEMHLVQYPDVTDAIAVLKSNKRNQQILCAYLKLDSVNQRVDESSIRSYLTSRLPYYMIPSYFIPIDTIPLTSNGKLDVNVLPDPDDVKTIGKVAAHNELEKISLQVWKDILGTDDIGVTDNFFELGGDSIKAVQIASKLANLGIIVAVRDILLFHNIEQISLRAETANLNNSCAQGIIEGERSFTPIESWFFNQDFKNPDYYNQSVLLKFNKTINIAYLQKAFSILIRHHDGLRINYNSQNNTLYYNDVHLDVHFKIDQHSLISDQLSEIEFYCRNIKGSFNISESLLIKSSVIRDFEGAELLFITAHHLVIDGFSWRVLLDDLYSVYQSLEKGESEKLPQKTAPSLDWEKKLMEYTSEIIDYPVEKDYWGIISNNTFTLPLDRETDCWETKYSKKITGILDRESTSFLLKDAHKTYNTDIPILLNTALILTLKEWTNSDKFLIEQENYGRYIEQINVSRTLGWFTAIYPVEFIVSTNEIGNQIKMVKEQIRRVPNHGLGYGIQKYFGRTPKVASKKSEIRFNYLGQFNKELNNELFTFSSLSTGSDIGEENFMTTKLEINLMIVDHQLRMEVGYNTNAHDDVTINRFRDTFFHHLKSILNHIKNEREVHFTPSDFNAAGLDQGELDELFL